MRERTELLIRGMSESRTKRGRWLALVTALAFLTGGNVFWELREIGTALTEDDMCTLEAHEHTESCYDESGALICGKEEHIHTAACFSDENADLETEEVWELTLPERDGIPRQEQVALIAESQLGYAESVNNFIRPEDGTQQGYTRYGAWYGNPYGEWNTMFVYFCLYYAGVSTEEIPCAGNARTWQVKLTESGLIRCPDSEPERGEIVLLDLDADGAADRAGILTNTEEQLTVIEGDCGNMVTETQYAPDAEQILGYVAIPEPDTPADEATTEENPPETEEAPTEETTAEAVEESGAETESSAETPMITYKAESESGILVSASAPPDAFPAEVTMRVTDVPHDEALQTASAHLEAEALDAVAVDISFIDAAGTEIEPALDKSVQVQITLPEEMYLSGNEYNLLHVSDEGEVQEVADAAVNGTGAEFAAESFSLYVLVSNQWNVDASQTPTIITQYPMENGANGGNSETNPLILGLGEYLTVLYQGDYKDSGHISVYPHGQSVLSRRLYGSSLKDFNEASYRRAEFVGNSVGTCNVVMLDSSDTTVENCYVKVVDKPVFKVTDDGKRVLLDNNTISADPGNKITLSLNGISSGAIPNTEDDSNYNAAYDISEYLHRGAPTYQNGNTFVEFTCKKEGSQKITVNGKELTFMIGNPPYIMDGTERKALDVYLSEHFYYSQWSHYGERVIYAYPGDEFTVSVNGYARHLISIPENSVISQKGSDIYSDGNTFVTIQCDAVGEGYINFLDRVDWKTGSVAYPVKVVVRDHNKDIYMMDGSDRRLIEDVLKEQNKYDFRDTLTIYALEGEKFTLGVNSTNADLVGLNASSEYLNRGTPVVADGKTDVEFECLKHTSSNDGTTFTVNGRNVKVFITHPIYVKTNIMERDIDRVAEWVSSQSWMPKHNGYNPNSENYPYLLYDSDAMTLRVPKSELTDAKLEIGTPYYFEKDKNDNNVKHEVSTYSALTLNEGSLTPDGDNINAVLLAHNTTEHDLIVPVYLKDGATTVRTMYVKVAKQGDNLLDHADIEIADGGKYTVTKLKRESDGTVKKIVTEYKAYVSGVNSSTLYQSQNDSKPCQFYYTSGNDILQYNSSVTGYVSSQYWVDPSIPKGSTQYELTSKYNLQTGYWSNTKFYANDVDHVVFDVVLSLEPSNEKEYTKNGSDWDLINTKTVFTDNDAKDIQSVKFAMDHQDVLDAYNKCPNHTGLDFTVMAFSALVEFDLNKELTGGTVQADQFSFEIIQKQVDFVRHWGNNYNGIVTRSYLDGLKSQGLKFKGAYRIFYDNPTKWGDGIDKEALVKELSTMPDFNSLNLNDAGTLFSIAQNDNESNKELRNKLFRVMQQYLINPEELTENGDDYKVRQDGFYLLSFESDPIQTVTNDANGIVTFNALHFEKDGDYNYIIREKPGKAANILYDRKEIDLQIRVSEEQKQLTANILSDISTFEFTNHTTYRLPDTGGVGTLPYYLGGTVLLAAASLLMIKKRREGS